MMMASLTYGALVILSLGLLTSMSVLALSHILLIAPILYFLPRTHFKMWSKSTWSLVAMFFVIIISVVCNQDVAIHGYAAISKSKYFLFGFLSIAPFAYYFKYHFNEKKDEKKISILLYAFFAASIIAGLAGIYGKCTGYNPISMRTVNLDRNAGLFGMVLNYAHNLAYFQVLAFGLILFKKEIEKYINLKFMYAAFAFNLFALYLTYTRGAWLAFLLGTPFYFFKNHKKGFAITAFILLLSGGLFYRLAGESVQRKGSDIERLSQWQAAWMAFQERPVLGYGYLNFENHSVPIKKRYNIAAPNYGGHAHNIFMEMLASTGIIGFLTLISWLGFWFLEMYKRDDFAAILGLPFIVTFIVSGLTQSTISLGVNLFFVMAIYSLTQMNIKLIKE